MKVLLIGPLPPPITGESLANNTVLKNLRLVSKFKIYFINNAYHSFKEDLGVFSMKKAWFYFKKYIQLYKVIDIDILYITLGQTFYGVIKYAPYIITAKLLRKKIVIHIHGNYLKTEYLKLKGIKKSLFKFLISKADKGIVLSKMLLPNLTPFISKKNIFILPNFTEKYLTEGFLLKQKNLEQLRILFLSNLMTEKGVLDLIEALNILSKKKISFKAKFAGNIDNSIKNEVLEKIKNNKSIEYLGVVSGDAKKELFIWGNVFVFPTYYAIEGQPISILEAMATGNIILTTKHGGIPDIFSENNGYFINKKDPNDIADKLISVLKNLTNLKPMMAYNHKYVSETFTEEMFVNSLIKILKK